MSCIIENISSEASAKLAEFGISSKTQKDLDRKAVQATSVNGLLDFPLAGALLDQVASFLQRTATGLASEATKRAVDTIVRSDAFATLSGTLAIATLISTPGTQLKTALFAIMVESLKRELRIRLMYYRLLQYHVNGILTTFSYYKNPTNKANRRRLELALRYVKEANRIYTVLERSGRSVESTSVKLPIPNSVSLRAYNTFFSDVETAAKILRGDPSYGKQLMNAIYGNTRSSTWQLLQEKFNQQVLAQNIYALETIMWNLARLAQLIPVPFTNLAYTEGLLINDSSLYGVTEKRFNKTAADKAIADLKAASGWNRTFSAIDATKGLIPTNIIIDKLIQGLMRFDLNFDNLAWTSNRILDGLSPVGSLIKTVAEEMQQALADNSSELVLAGKETTWVSELESIRTFQSLFLGAISNLSNTTWTIAHEINLQNCLLDYQAGTNYNDTIPPLLLDLITVAPQALTSFRSLTRGIRTGTVLSQILQRAITIDTKLLSAAEAVNVATDPLLGELLKSMTKMQSPASEIATALLSGQLFTVTALFTGIVSGSRSIVDSIGAISKCKSEENIATDSFIDEMNELGNRRYDQGYS